MTKKLEVLVIDDEPIVGKRLTSALVKLDCHVEAFTDSGAAIRRFEEHPFDIVVTDILMDDPDGIEVLDRVLAVRPETKVIMITGYAMMEVARRAMEKGAFEFVSKPFTPDVLRKVVIRAASEVGVVLSDGKREP